MRIAVIGPGSVGGYFGGRLAQSGEEVCFIAHGRTAAALRERGLRVDSIKGDFALPKVQVSESGAEVGPVDLVMVSVKGWHVPEAGKVIPPLLGPETVVLPLLNGVEADEQFSAVAGAQRMLIGLCGIMSTVVEPGHIKHFGLEPFITLGERDNSQTPRVERVRETIAKAGIQATVPKDVHVRLWLKFMFITAMSGVGSVSRSPASVVRSTPATRELARRAVAEIDALAHACGVNMPDSAIDDTLAVIDNLPPGGTTSMQRDLLEGRPSELETLCGAVVRLARKHGLKTPVADAIYAALLPAELRARGELKFDRL